MSSRGFVTIATGDEKYYKLAVRLVRSYRDHCSDNVPFAIICDQKNEYTQEFDFAIVMESPSKSYMDKLLIYRYSPFDETIFIDADSLVLSDISALWTDYASEDDVSCSGAVYPLDSDRGWFTYEGCEKYKDQIRYVIDLHGGLYYFRKNARCRAIFETAISLAEEYESLGFRAFSRPADEPVLALSMAIHDCRPCTKPAHLLFVPSYRGQLRVNPDGDLFLKGKRINIEIIHFATPNTERFLYQYLAAKLEQSRIAGKSYNSFFLYWKIKFKTAPNECKAAARHLIGQMLRRILPANIVQRLRERM